VPKPDKIVIRPNVVYVYPNKTENDVYVYPNVTDETEPQDTLAVKPVTTPALMNQTASV